jgi:hypothetical protein
MSPERQDEIMNALEAINPAETEATLIADGISAVVRILNCSRENASGLITRLRKHNKLKLIVVEAGGIPDERKALQNNRFRWSR